MASLFRRLCYKYTKCIVVVVVIAFFVQIFIAICFFPTVNDNLLNKNGYASDARQALDDVSARKNNEINDDEDFPPKDKYKPGSVLRLEELDFKPLCEIKSREAISAIHRAKTQHCKQEIVNKTCLIEQGNFYPKRLPNTCPQNGMSYGNHLGCYVDEKKTRLLSGYYGNFANTNSPHACLDICVQAGFSYAGVQYGSECFCGENAPPGHAKLAAESCDMKCPADPSQTCGGYFTMNIYETGMTKFVPRIPNTLNENKEKVRIIFLLTLNGRALRQVHRLINVLYRENHYFYIHVDKRQDYLHRELLSLENKFSNIKLATNRYSTIWGGASLLTMLLSAMRDIFELQWEWDFVINLSESDFPIKSLENLENFLAANKGLNFVKSHGREVQRFIKKQGLDKTFVECDTHMWRTGDRKLPSGIVIDGGSDWVALSPDFVSYLLRENDELLTGLHIIFQHTLLPAESFFHTALRNSQFCDTYVDNNLHVTNWKRKLGCKCQYKHVVDWCGCSPNDFRPADWPRIQNTKDRQLFFARKFEPIINQEILNRVEQYIGFKDHYQINNLEGYWQSLYNVDDLTAITDDLLLTHAGSIVRRNTKILSEERCYIVPDTITEITSYNHGDIYKGNLILHKAILDNKDIMIETWYKPKKHLDVNFRSHIVDNIKSFRVSSDYDQKELTFRNFASILGPLSEPSLLYQFSVLTDMLNSNLRVVWLDPVGLIADVNELNIDESNLTSFIKPTLKTPLLPGIWKVGLFEENNYVASTKFLVTPLEYFSGKELSHQEATIIHSGSQNSYKKYSSEDFKAFSPDNDENMKLQKISNSNIKRTKQDLRDWVDSLTAEFYSVLGTCVATNNNNLNDKMVCGSQIFEYCTSTQWSSLSPDPKGSIGKLNKISGRLERI